MAPRTVQRVPRMRFPNSVVDAIRAVVDPGREHGPRFSSDLAEITFVMRMNSIIGRRFGASRVRGFVSATKNRARWPTNTREETPAAARLGPPSH